MFSNYLKVSFSSLCFFTFWGNWRLQIRFQSILFSKYRLVSLLSLHLFTFWGNWRPQYEAALHFLLPKPQSQSGPLLLNIRNEDFSYRHFSFLSKTPILKWSSPPNHHFQVWIFELQNKNRYFFLHFLPPKRLKVHGPLLRLSQGIGLMVTDVLDRIGLIVTDVFDT